MKKTIAGLCLLLSLLMILGGCGKGAAKRYDYDLAEYVSIAQWDKIRAPFGDPTVCTEEEIDEAVFQIMLTYADYSLKEEGSVAEQYDKLVVNYKIYHDGQELTEYAQNQYGIVVGYDGTGDIDAALAEKMLGKKVGEKCSVSYTFPTGDISLGSWAGVTVECHGELVELHRTHVPEITDEFVQTIGEHGFTSVQEFRDQLKEDILSQKQEAKKTIVMNTFMEGVEVKKYPEAELEQYVDKYLSEISSAAAELGVEYVEYVEEYLDTTEDAISQAATEDAKSRVKSDLACIQASRLLQVELSDEEYEEGLERYYESEKDLFDSVEEFEEFYTKDFMWECIRWDKSFLIMVENAVSNLDEVLAEKAEK